MILIGTPKIPMHRVKLRTEWNHSKGLFRLHIIKMSNLWFQHFQLLHCTK